MIDSTFRRGRLPWWTAAAALAVMLPTLRATAAPVRLTCNGCDADFEADVRRIVAVEIGDLLLPPVEPVEGPVDHVHVAWQGDSVEIAAKTFDDGRLGRTVALDPFPPESRARVVALAAVEVLAALSPEVHQRLARPEAEPAPVISAAAPSANPSSVEQPWRLTLGGLGRLFLAERGMATLGLRLTFEREVSGPLGVAVDLDVSHGRRTASLGTVSGTLGSGALALSLRAGYRGLSLRGGLGFRLGVGRLEGLPRDPAEANGRQAVRPWAGPMASASLIWGHQAPVLSFGVEAGYAALGAVGRHEALRLAAVTGPWVCGSVAIGIATNP